MPPTVEVMAARRASLAAHRDTFARQARHRFDRHEGMLQPAVADAIGAWLDKARPLALGSLTAAAPMPGMGLPGAMGQVFTGTDADAMLARLGRLAGGDTFARLLTEHVQPVYLRILDEVLGSALSDGRVGAALTAWRGQWLEDRMQAMVGIPDTIVGIFRTQLRGLAERKGTNVDDATALTQKMLDRGYDAWQGRARMIARTEVVGANNQGSLQSWSTLAHASGQPATKTWLATEDSKTRPHHRDMDGKAVSIDADFMVGGRHAMNGPGDNRGPAEEVINCRCTLTYAFDDGAPPPAGLTAAGEGDNPGNSIPANDTPTGVAIMAVLTAELRDKLLAAGVPEPPAPGFHCTLGYLRDPAADIPADTRASLLDALAPLAAELPVAAEAFATAHFNPDSDERDPCAVLLVQSDELAELHEAVAGAIASMADDTFPVWIPHVALAYNAAPEDVVPPGLVGTEMVFDRLVVGWGGEQIEVGLDPSQDDGGEALTAAQEAPVTAPPAPLADDAPAVTAPPADAGTIDLTPKGPTWQGPIAMLDTPSSDGRIIASTGGTIRTLPLPLNWQREYAHGGIEEGGVVMVGRILAAEVRGNVLWGSGDYLDPMLNYDAQQAMAQVEAGLGLCSVDLSVSEQGYADAAGNPIDPGLVDAGTEVNSVALVWELGGNTIVSFPAFDGCRITNDPPAEGEATTVNNEIGGVPVMPETFTATVAEDGASVTLDGGVSVAPGEPVGYPTSGGVSVGTLTSIDATAGTAVVTPAPADDGTQPDDVTVQVADLTAVPEAGADDAMDDEDTSLMASSALRPYNSAYFAQRDLQGPTPLTYVPETGEVYGHLATWGECHVGKLQESGQCVTAPHSERDYADFHLGTVFTDAGPLDVGKITVGTGHAPARGSFAATVAHYDNSGTATSVVRAYEDDYGVQVSGQVIHDTPPERIEEMLRSPLSGDWRLRNNNLELCAALAVNVPGFPVRRMVPRVGLEPKAGNRQLSLVAAGVVDLAPRKVDGKELIGLPSGATITRDDFGALVAAAVEVVQRGGKPAAAAASEAQALAARRARARLALALADA